MSEPPYHPDCYICNPPPLEPRRRHLFGLPLVLAFPDHTPTETIERLIDEIQAHVRTIFLMGMAIGLAFGMAVVALLN